MPNRINTLSLRVVLTVPFVILILVTGTLIGYLTLQASEARYRSLFEGVPVGIYRSSPEGRLLDVNPALINMFGYPDRATVLRMNATDFYTNTLDRTRWQAELERDGGASSFEMQMYTYHRTVIWVQNNARIARGADGDVLYYEGSLEDITARKQAEQERSRLLHALHKRIKDLTALHQAARILQHGRMGTPALLHDLAALLPPAFQYPEVTAACVRLGDHEATTPGFADALQLLCTDFTTVDGARGSITVAYTDERPAEAEGPFLAEERQLIESLADILRTASDRTQAEAALRDSEMRFRATQRFCWSRTTRVYAISLIGCCGAGATMYSWHPTLRARCASPSSRPTRSICC